MRKSAWYMILGAAVLAVAAAGCGDDDGVIDFDAGPGGDSGMPGDASVPPDAPDAGPVMCGAVGRLGGNCRTNTCLEGMCYAVPAGAAETYGDIGWAPAAADDPEDPTAWTTITPADPSQDVRFAIATGSVCTEQCDLASETDTCAGDCSSCSASLSADSLGVPAYFLYLLFGEELEFDTDTGMCRAHCVFDPATNGGCPSGQTCDPFTNICTDACRGDNSCNATLVVNEDGDYATWIVPDGGRTCSATTGRCEWTQADTTTVGNACDSSNDCTEDVGICLRGGTCAETQCGTASDTDPSTGICDGGAGLCLPAGGNQGTVCVQGCATSDDCNPGNACVPLLDRDGNPLTIGTFSGYCLGTCDTVDSSTASFEDEIIGCGTHDGVVEQCDMPAATAEDPDPSGTCSPTCNPLAAPGETGSCDADELCEAVTGTSYGFCRTLNTFCTEDAECIGGQICSTALTPGVFGRCVNPCNAETNPTACAAPEECVTTGTLEGLCATPCSTAVGGDAGVGDAGADDAGADDAGADDAGVGDAGVGDAGTRVGCGTGRVCQVPAGMTDGYCVPM